MVVKVKRRKKKCIACGGTKVSTSGKPCVCVKKRNKRPIEMDLLVPTNPKLSSEFWDFERDGMSPSALECWHRDREEFRLAWVEGWSDEGYKEHLDFGNIWHELMARHQSGFKVNVKQEIAKYRKKEAKKQLFLPADLATQEVVNCQVMAMWPSYLDWYPDDDELEWISAEKQYIHQITINEVETFIRGTIDGIYRRRGKIRVRDLKTKAQINLMTLEDVLLLDIQMMVYVFLAGKLSGEEIEGIDYDIIRRPGTKPWKQKAETLQMYTKRLRTVVEKDPPHYFARIEKDVCAEYTELWVKQTLIPMMMEVHAWSMGLLPHYSAGAQSLVQRPWSSRFIPMMTRGDTTGMKQQYSYDYQVK